MAFGVALNDSFEVIGLEDDAAMAELLTTLPTVSTRYKVSSYC